MGFYPVALIGVESFQILQVAGKAALIESRRVTDGVDNPLQRAGRTTEDEDRFARAAQGVTQRVPLGARRDPAFFGDLLLGARDRGLFFICQAPREEYGVVVNHRCQQRCPS